MRCLSQLLTPFHGDPLRRCIVRPLPPLSDDLFDGDLDRYQRRIGPISCGPPLQTLNNPDGSESRYEVCPGCLCVQRKGADFHWAPAHHQPRRRREKVH